MSALLRSVKFLRCFSGVSRNYSLGANRTDPDSLVNSQKQLAQQVNIRSLSLLHATIKDDQHVGGGSGGAAAAVAGGRDSLDEKLMRIDRLARRSGRIKTIDFNQLVHEVNNASSISGYQGLLLLRCCGDLAVGEFPENRTQLALNIWNILTSLGVPLDVSHYNALLRVYLENNHEFSPPEFLSMMRSNNVSPNRVTYQRLIYRYCLSGDVEGATDILGHMKDNSMAINESVFNSLIIGHARAKDLEHAESMISIMRRSNLEPSPETFRHLACGYVECGQPEQIWTVLKTASDNDSTLPVSQLIEVLYSLAVNGYSDSEHVDKLLATIESSSMVNSDTTAVTLRLVDAGHDELAYRLYHAMPPVPTQGAHSSDTRAIPNAFFVRHLTRRGRPASVILSFCERLRDEHQSPSVMLVAVRQALMAPIEPQRTLQLITALPSFGYQLRPHYFWPLLAQCGRDVSALTELLHRITTLDCPLDSETFVHQVFPQVDRADLHHFLVLLNQAGIGYRRTAVMLCRFHLATNNVSEALAVMCRYNAVYSPKFFVMPLVACCSSQFNAQDVVSVLRVLCTSSPASASSAAATTASTAGEEDVDSSSIETERDDERNSRQVASNFLIKAVRAANLTGSQLEHLIKHMVSCGTGVTSECVSDVQSQLADWGVGCSPQLSSLLEELSSEHLCFVPLESEQMASESGDGVQGRRRFFRPLRHRMNALDEQLAVAHEAQQDTMPLLVEQLHLLVNAGQLEKADQVKQEIERIQGGQFSVDALRALVEFSATSGNFDQTRNLFDQWTKQHPESLDDVCVLNAARLLLVSGTPIADIISLLASCPRDDRGADERDGLTGRRAGASIEEGAYFRSVWASVNGVCETRSTDDARALLDALVTHGYITEKTPPLYALLVHAHLKSGDLASCTAEWKEIAKRFHVVPGRHQVMKTLITADDSKRLQEVIDLSNEVVGEMDTLYDLALCLIECGKARHANKVLLTPGFRVSSERLESTCSRYLYNNQTSEIEALLGATKHLLGVDRLRLYDMLLTGLCRKSHQDTGHQLLSLWTKLQDEGLVASEEMLCRLADKLTTFNMDVPFTVSSLNNKGKNDDLTKSTGRENVNQGENQLLPQWKAAIRAGNTKRALELRHSLREAAVKPTVHDLSRLIQQLLDAGSVREAGELTLDMLQHNSYPMAQAFKRLLHQLSDSGDVATLTAMKPLLSHTLASTLSFETRLCLAYAKSTRADEYLLHLEDVCDRLARPEEDEKQQQHAKTDSTGAGVPLGGFLQMCKLLPEHRDRLTQLAERFTEKGKTGPINMLWIYHMLEGDFTTAEALFNSHLKNCSHIHFHSLIESGSVDLLRRLLHALSTAPSVTAGARGCVVTALLKQTAKSEPSSAKEMFEASGLSPSDLSEDGQRLLQLVN